MSGFGQHYKGDVSEVTMGHETGLSLQHGVPATWTAAVTVGNSGTKDYTEIMARDQNNKRKSKTTRQVHGSIRILGGN